MNGTTVHGSQSTRSGATTESPTHATTSGRARRRHLRVGSDTRAATRSEARSGWSASAPAPSPPTSELDGHDVLRDRSGRDPGGAAIPATSPTCPTRPGRPPIVWAMRGCRSRPSPMPLTTCSSSTPSRAIHPRPLLTSRRSPTRSGRSNRTGSSPSTSRTATTTLRRRSRRGARASLGLTTLDRREVRSRETRPIGGHPESMAGGVARSRPHRSASVARLGGR